MKGRTWFLVTGFFVLSSGKKPSECKYGIFSEVLLLIVFPPFFLEENGNF